MLRRTLLGALCCAALASCGSGANGAFALPSATPGGTVATGAATIDTATLGQLRSSLVSALAAHTGAQAGAAWTQGVAHPLAAGPYTEASADPLLRLAGVAVAAPLNLSGLDGGYLASAYLLAARGLGTPPAIAPACDKAFGAAGESAECDARQASDALLARWYARDTKSFFHVGDTTTEYRPVDAIATGCALVVAGFREQNFDKIEAGQAIVTKELKADFDPHYQLLYGRMTATAGGPRQPLDYNTRLADQAGAAEMLLQAFEASREQQYQAGAAQALQPLLQEPVTLRARGYLTGFDLQGAGPAAGPVDVEATLLTLQAAHHYDATDGNHYARLEEVAASAIVDSVSGLDVGLGLPAAVVDGRPSTRSAFMTALGIVVLGDVAAASPSPGP